MNDDAYWIRCQYRAITWIWKRDLETWNIFASLVKQGSRNIYRNDNKHVANCDSHEKHMGNTFD